jgi:hypothetical protein
MSAFKKHKPTAKKTVANKNSTVTDTGNKSPYSKQNIKKKLNEFGDTDSL